MINSGICAHLTSKRVNLSPRRRRLNWYVAAGASTLAAAAAPAFAQSTTPAPQDKVVEEVIVTGSKSLTGVMEKRASSTAFGIDKDLVDTPRSVTAISDDLLERYNIKTVYDFTAVAAGTYTGSYFGVPGSLNIRGTIADNYFNGFQTITNFANYPTPVDASSNIELVRGPASPLYGAGQIGGYLNFIPKSARGDDAKYQDKPTATVTATVGSYNQKEMTAEGGAPFKFMGNSAGIYGFMEFTDSDSYYIGDHPKSQIGQITFNTDIGSHWTFTATAQFINSTGALKDIGWNRVTQDLIDNDNYISGTALTKIATPGASFITPAAYAAANAAAVKSGSDIQQYVLPIYGVTGQANPYTELNPSTVKTVKLSPRQTDLSASDINNATTPILFFGLSRDLGGYGTIKLESFTQHLDALNYQSYGFGTSFRTTVNEERLTYNFKNTFADGMIKSQTAVGASYRFTDAFSASYLNDGVGSQDRWDLSQPQTADEIFNNVFHQKGRDGYQYDDQVTSHQTDIGEFLLEDVLLLDHLDITGGVRSDHYDLNSKDDGAYGGVVQGQVYKGDATATSYNISVSLKNPYLTPYFTYARSYSLNVDQGDAVDPSLLPSATTAGSFLGTSTLHEIGVKTSQFGGRLYASADFYRQQNQYLDARDFAVDAEVGEGFEGELRYLVTKNLGLTGTVTLQHVRQLGGGEGSGPFLVLTPAQAGVASANGYGGQYETNAKFLGLSNGYDLHTTPRAAYSLFSTYDEHGAWGLTGGVTYNTSTGGSLPDSIHLPPYALFKAGAYISFFGVRADVYVDNLLDRRYFLAEYDVDANATVLPGIGREFHLKLTKKY